jgi:hypothetical protein
MFDSLAEQIKHDEHIMVSNAERMLRWLVIALFSVLIFGGVLFSVHYFE